MTDPVAEHTVLAPVLDKAEDLVPPPSQNSDAFLNMLHPVELMACGNLYAQGEATVFHFMKVRRRLYSQKHSLRRSTELKYCTR